MSPILLDIDLWFLVVSGEISRYSEFENILQKHRAEGEVYLAVHHLPQLIKHCASHQKQWTDIIPSVAKVPAYFDINAELLHSNPDAYLTELAAESLGAVVITRDETWQNISSRAISPDAFVAQYQEQQSNPHVPFVDLRAQYRTIDKQIDKVVDTVWRETAFIGGKNSYVQRFEAEFAEYIGLQYCMSCANGTDSLEILLMAMGIGQGDEVLVPALSWISTSEAVSAIGAKPVFVDIHPLTYTINPALIEEKITPRTKAIIPVHLYGMPAAMDEIMYIAHKHNLLVLEDCAQAHGAEYKGKKVGTFGDCASFSFYPGKNLGAYGDAGAMLTNNPDINRLARMIAQHGQEGKHNHLREGRNSRLDGVQAAILSVKLPFLDQWTEKRIAHAQRYTELLNTVQNVIPPMLPAEHRHVFHLYVVQLEQRDAMMEYFKKHGVETAIHYPTPLPMMPAYAAWGHQQGDFPVAEQACKKILSLPMYPEMTDNMLQKVIKLLKNGINEL